MSTIDVTALQIDTVAFGRLQQELGVYASNSIVQQVQIERLERRIKDLLDHIQALTERCTRLDADNDKMRSERSPEHAKMRETQARIRERELSRAANDSDHTAPSSALTKAPSPPKH